MKFSFIKTRRELQAYIQSFWVFESLAGLPAAGGSIAAPNGCCKLIFRFGAPLVSVANGRTVITPAQKLYFVGNRDTVARLQSSSQKIGCICIEFRPHGIFPIFGIPMDETFSVHWQAEVLLGNWAREVQEVLNNLQSLNEKVGFLQDQLIHLLRKNNRGNDLITYCVQALKATNGRLQIRELARQTGYTRRYLDLLFKEQVGLSPKALAGIFRFQRFYRQWAEGHSFQMLKDELYDFYYDQAHFAREFKKMTGHSPRTFNLRVCNEFGRRLSLG